MKGLNKNTITIIMVFLAIVFVNIIANQIYTRVDLTKEKRHSLTESSQQIIESLDDIVYIKVYLEGDFPAGFKRLRNSTEDLLEEFRAYNSDKFEFQFIDPFEGKTPEEVNEIKVQLAEKGLTPTAIQNMENESYSSKVIIPGALINYKGKELPLHLLQSQLGVSPQEALNNSVSKLEFGFISTIRRLMVTTKPKVAFVHGHGELINVQVQDLVESLDPYYQMISIDLPTITYIPNDIKTLVIADPQGRFNEEDKVKIDQFIMNGGKVLWLVETMQASMDSMMGKQSYLANRKDLNLEDQLFTYGARINPNVVQDIQCAPHPFITGYMGNVPQQNMFDWYYFPLVVSQSQHPIVNNMDAILFRFANSIDTIKVPGVKKTVLLQSSQYSRLLHSPVRLSLSILKDKPQPGMFNKPHQPLAVLLEGEFPSLYKNRATGTFAKMYKKATSIDFKTVSKATKMIVVSDGDIIKNEVDKQGNVFPTGYYKFTQTTFANKQFLINAIMYLTDPMGIVESNAKSVILRKLDTTRIKKEQTWWQWLNIIAPICIVLLFGLIFNIIRLKKYSNKL